jgi:hypothetical protein
LDAGKHAPKTGEAGAAKEVHKHGLCLIVGVVSDCYVRSLLVPGDLLQKSVTDLAGGLLLGQPFAIRDQGNINLFTGKGYTPGFGDLSHPGHVPVGFLPPNAVVEMRDVKCQGIGGGQSSENV